MASTEEVMKMRAQIGFVTPIRPLEPGDTILVFDTRGTKEWLAHPSEAGVPRYGMAGPLEVIEHWPLMNAVQVRASDHSVNTRWIPPGEAA